MWFFEMLFSITKRDYNNARSHRRLIIFHKVKQANIIDFLNVNSPENIKQPGNAG